MTEWKSSYSPRQIAEIFHELLDKVDINTAIETHFAVGADDRFFGANPGRWYWIREPNIVELEILRLSGVEVPGNGRILMAVKKLSSGLVARFPHKFPLKKKYVRELNEYLAHRCFQTASAAFPR